MAMHRRKVLKGIAARRRLASAQGALCPGPGRAHPRRLPDREDRPARLGRPADGAGPSDLPEGPQEHAGRPAGGAHHRGHHRQSGGLPHQDAGAGGALQRVLRARPARRVRGAGDRRLHPLLAHADARRCRRRGPDAAQGQSVVHAAGLDLGAAEPSDGRLRRQGAEVQARRDHRGRFRVRSRERRRLPARVRGYRAARWCRSCGPRSTRPTTAPTSRSSSPTSTRSSPAMPDRTA